MCAGVRMRAWRGAGEGVGVGECHLDSALALAVLVSERAKEHERARDVERQAQDEGMRRSPAARARDVGG